MSIDDLQPKRLGELPIPDEYHMKTQMMFQEFFHQSQSAVPPIFTLRRQDHKFRNRTYKSMYLMYMACTSEYEAALTILGSWGHWQKLLQCKWFMKHLKLWRDEMDLRDKALAKKAIKDKTEKGDVPAAKALHQLASGVPVGKRGRPVRGGQGVKGNRPTAPLNEDIDEMLGHADGLGDE